MFENIDPAEAENRQPANLLRRPASGRFEPKKAIGLRPPAMSTPGAFQSVFR